MKPFQKFILHVRPGPLCFCCGFFLLWLINRTVEGTFYWKSLPNSRPRADFFHSTSFFSIAEQETSFSEISIFVPQSDLLFGVKD